MQRGTAAQWEASTGSTSLQRLPPSTFGPDRSADAMTMHHSDSSATSTYRRTACLPWRSGRCCVLVLSRDEVHRLDGTSRAVWDLLEDPVTIDELVAGLGSRFDGMPTDAAEEVGDLLARLADLGLVTAT